MHFFLKFTPFGKSTLGCSTSSKDCLNLSIYQNYSCFLSAGLEERVSERVHEKLDVQFVVPFVGSSAQTSFGFFWASFYVCVLWTACLTALWGSFMFECGLKCSSYAVVACFGANAVSKCPAWPLKPLLV